MSEAVMEKPEAKAKPLPAGKPGAPQGELTLRQRAALEAFGAFVARHGGFNPGDMEAHVRKVWEYADCFVRLETAPPLPPQKDWDVLEAFNRGQQPREKPAPKQRAAHPTDEWAVYDGDRRYKGFVGREEAEFFASARPGAKVVQVAGPGADAGNVADPSVSA